MEPFAVGPVGCGCAGGNLFQNRGWALGLKSVRLGSNDYFTMSIVVHGCGYGLTQNHLVEQSAGRAQENRGNAGPRLVVSCSP